MAGRLFAAVLRAARPRTLEERRMLFYGALPALLLAAAAYAVASLRPPRYPLLDPPDHPMAPTAPGADIHTPVRDEPRRFRARAHMPNIRESAASGAIRLSAFFPEYDLVRIDDPRVWWESDHDADDTEDDHLIHRVMEEPLKRLIELVHREGGTLKVQDAYRAEGIHAVRSLHKEGRAVDLTCDELGLEKLAKLCWAAGFDWVYHEAPRRGGAHVHASVKAQQ